MFIRFIQIFLLYLLSIYIYPCLFVYPYILFILFFIIIIVIYYLFMQVIILIIIIKSNILFFFLIYINFVFYFLLFYYFYFSYLYFFLLNYPFLFYFVIIKQNQVLLQSNLVYPWPIQNCFNPSYLEIQIKARYPNPFPNSIPNFRFPLPSFHVCKHHPPYC